MKQSEETGFWQTTLSLPKKGRGFHLITDDIRSALANMPDVQVGLLNIFLQHTSASLTISENTCREVREDLEQFFNRIAPDGLPLYTHTVEGEDDMPAHIKNAMLGSSLTIPLNNNSLWLGQWQGIYLCEHRNHAPARSLVLTVQGR
ncbi:secondary thiamine-phosphate synthase enzyme YjbQ [Legionella yabuuchiae]|uniref:secondary thiamine-phosphate synthase enzyme YjbQ n=1 Tax=Legionella yabuuchiae TaxID=376727 RepID=UPI00105598DF|nr:secondary thiamine-phosphate synthase enzyme YjbQ [Legionella yabuuchiae]